MTSDRHERLTELFTRASELPADERDAFLARECADDGLRAEVLELLGVERASYPLLDGADSPLLAPLGAARQRDPGERIGRFVIERWLGSGGAGDIYLAHQERPQRQVAVKVMRHGLTHASALRRFEFEAQLLGRLEHPGIARLYEADVFEDRGRSVPYFAMEYVEGARTLTDYARERGLDLRARLALFVEVCEAVAHGHRQGVVHCDLKPENVLLNRNGRVCVIDFGIARATDVDRAMTTRETGFVAIAGTLPYMSPEQVAGDGRRIDPRADVYGLGVLLFELLTGEHPLDLRERSLPQAVHDILEREPRRLGQRDRQLRGDVDTICAKALSKEREGRYESAAELAADVRRFLANEPVHARRPTAVYQLRKFARRHRGFVAGCVLALVALFVGSGVAVQQAVKAHARDVASRWLAYRGNIAAAAAALDAHDIALARAKLEDAPVPRRRWEWRYFHARLDESVRVLELPGDGLPGPPLFGPGVVRAERGGQVASFDLVRGKLLDTAPAELLDVDPSTGAEARCDGAALVVRRGEAQERLELAALGLGDLAPDVLRLARGARFAVLASPRRVARVDLVARTAAVLERERGPSGVAACDVSASGLVALAATARGPLVWAPASDETVALRDVPGFVRAIAFDDAGARVVAGLQTAELGLWSASSGERLSLRRGHRHAVTAVAFAPGGHVLSGSLDRSLQVWDAAGLEPVATLQGHTRGVRHVAASADGAWFASTSEDGTLRLWDARSLTPAGTIEGAHPLVFPVAFSADGGLLASGGSDGFVRLWDPVTYRGVAELDAAAGTVTALAFSADGARLVAACERALVAWDLDAGRRTASLELPPGGAAIADLAFLADGVRVALPVDLGGGRVRVWDTTTGATEAAELATLGLADGRLVEQRGRFAVLYARRDGASAASRIDSDTGAELVVLDLRNGAARVPLPPLSGAFAFRPRAFRPELAARSADDPTRVLLIDLAHAEVIGELVGHSDRVYDVGYSPDGERIATSARDGVRLWSPQVPPAPPGEAPTGREVVGLSGHRSFVWSVSWSSDGQRLATGSGDGSVRVWDTAPFARVHARRADEAAARVDRERVDAALAAAPDVTAAARALRNRTDWSAGERQRARRELLRRHAWH